MTGERSLSVFITQYDDVEGNKVANNIRRLHSLSDGRHRIIDDPNSADIILIGGLGNEISMRDYVRSTLSNGFIDKFANKCFTLSYRDRPIIFNRGIYESGSYNLISRSRCRGGAYALSGHQNAHIVESERVERDLLFSFIGRMSHRSRQQLLRLKFRRTDHIVEDTTSFNYWSAAAEVREEREVYYGSIMSRSKFCICPRGVGTGSIRLFEAMRAGVAPVIISDGWIPPAGIDWRSFAIFLPEAQLQNLESILIERENDYRHMGDAARVCWQQNFSPTTHFNYLVQSCLEIEEAQAIPEALYWRARYMFAAGRAATALLKSKLRALRGGDKA